MNERDIDRRIAYGDRPSDRSGAPSGMEVQMVRIPRVFLEDVLDAFNRIPNRRLDNERWRSTYGMAAALSYFLKSEPKS